MSTKKTVKEVVDHYVATGNKILAIKLVRSKNDPNSRYHIGLIEAKDWVDSYCHFEGWLKASSARGRMPSTEEDVCGWRSEFERIMASEIEAHETPNGMPAWPWGPAPAEPTAERLERELRSLREELQRKQTHLTACEHENARLIARQRMLHRLQFVTVTLRVGDALGADHIKDGIITITNVQGDSLDCFLGVLADAENEARS